jgi:hypothetical protein
LVWGIIKMRIMGIVALGAALSGCAGGGSVVQSSVFAQPEVLYHSGNNVGLSYFNSGVQASFNEHGAMDLLAKECPRGFKVTGRTGEQKVTIDAVCGA